jgi:hypothetical protein
VPRVISDFVEQTLLFKIDVKNDVNSGFEQSFRVKKVCANQDIVTRFKSVVKVVYTLLHVLLFSFLFEKLSCLFI